MAQGKRIEDAGEVGRRIIDLERKVSQVVQSTIVATPFVPRWAKVTKNNEDGTYDLTEQIINATNTDWDDKEGALVWEKGDDSNLKEAREINGDDSITVDTICIVFKTHQQAHGKNDWVIIATTEAGGGTVAKTTRSNTAIKNKIQFRNDIDFNAEASEIVNLQLGDISNGAVAYGGNEQGGDSEDIGYQRHYKYIWDVRVPIAGYLMPGTNSQVQSTADDQGIGKINEMWIRMDHRFNGQVCEVHHGVLNAATFATDEGKFNKTPAGGTLATVYGAPTSGGSPTIKMVFDRTGHLKELDSYENTDIDYPKDVNIEQTSDDAPSSGTLYNVSINQTTNLVDDAGANTDAFNDNNALSWQARDSKGAPLDIGFTVSTADNGIIGNATTYAGAGTGGNDDPIFYDLSKTLDGIDVTIESTLLVNNRKSNAVISGIESVELECDIQTTPVPDGSSFDVKVALVYGPNATTGTPGDRISRFDNATAEYAVRVYLFYEALKDSFDPTIAATYEATGIEDVIDKTTYSGNLVSFNENWPDEQEGAKLCARAYLVFQQAIADPQPLPNQVSSAINGFCNITNAGDFAEDCQSIAGTAATGTVAIAADTYSPESTGPDLVIDGVTHRQVAPIDITFTISKGGNTTDFSTAGISSTIKLYNGASEIDFSADGTAAFGSSVAIINPVAGTDGWTYTINYIAESAISDGNTYMFEVTTAGVSDSPNTDTFQFNSASAMPQSDDFSGTGQNSTSVGGTNFDLKWTENNTASASQAIVSEDLVHTCGASVSQVTARTESRFKTDKNITTDTWKIQSNFTDMAFAGSGTESMYIEAINANGTPVDMRAGWRDNGTGGQKFFVYDGSSEVVADSDTPSSGKVTIERGDFALSDNFSGIAPNSGSVSDGYFKGRWRVSNTEGTASITSGAFRYTVDSGSPKTLSYINTGKYTGDFVVTVDASAVTYSDTNTSQTAQLRIHTAGGGFLGQISANRVNGSSGNFAIDTENTGGQTLELVNGGLSWSFKAERIGSTTTFYYDIGGGWVAGTRTISSSATMEFYLMSGSRWTGGNLVIDYDQFTSDVTTQKRVLFSKDTTLKYAFDDSGDDLTDIDIVTDTTHTAAFTGTYKDIIVESPTGTTFTFDP